MNKADLPSEVVKAHSISGVCVRTAHFHFELRVKQKHKVDPAVVSVHVHQEGVLHNQPAARPAKAELMMTDAVQALDPVASRPLEDGSFPETHVAQEILNTHSVTGTTDTEKKILDMSAYRPLGPRSVTKESAPTERNSSCKKRTPESVVNLYNIQHVCVFILEPLPCCDHSCRTHSPADRSGTPQGISAV